ncbi:MAG: homocysteine methyltransferase [Planctomycetes bacterium]|nr:homocysteine methyltransferase [Planctomycetota bacterium]
MENIPPADADAQLVAGILDGFRISKAVFTAVSLGLFDRLHDGPATAAELASALGCQEHALERLLGACAGLGLLAVEKGRWRNLSAAERLLRVRSPETLSGYILYSDRILYRLWARLAEALREGTHRWEQEFGRREGIFEHFFASEEDKLAFLAGMHGQGLLSSPAAAAAFDLSRFRQLVDLGGATGHLAIEACKRYPRLRATVFDLPPVVPVAQRYIRAAGLESRIDTASGDFFKDPLPPGDLYAAGRILHDWSEEKVRFLLKKIHDRLPAGGGLLICEKILNDQKDGPATALLQSLNMLVCTEGRERTGGEYEALVREAGFASFQARRTERGVDAMLATKGG